MHLTKAHQNRPAPRAPRGAVQTSAALEGPALEGPPGFWPMDKAAEFCSVPAPKPFRTLFQESLATLMSARLKSTQLCGRPWQQGMGAGFVQGHCGPCPRLVEEVVVHLLGKPGGNPEEEGSGNHRLRQPQPLFKDHLHLRSLFLAPVLLAASWPLTSCLFAPSLLPRTAIQSHPTFVY